MMDLIRTIHGEMRWIVALLGIIVVVKFIIGWLGKRDYQPLDRYLLLGYTISLDINVLLGLILLFSMGINTSYRIEHAVTMLLSAAAAHATAIWRRSSDDASKFRNQMLLALLSLLLVIMGVLRVRAALGPGGFF